MSLGWVADDLADYVACGDFGAVRKLGVWLNAEGGAELMMEVFNLALARRGYASCQGVNGAWGGLGNWDAP